MQCLSCMVTVVYHAMGPESKLVYMVTVVYHVMGQRCKFVYIK